MKVAIKTFLLILEGGLALWFLLPVFRGVHNEGTYAGLFSCAVLLLVTIFSAPLSVFLRVHFAKIWFRIAVFVILFLLAAGVTFCGVMSVQMVRAMHNPPVGAKTAVILGARIKGTTPTEMLQRRLEAALSYLQENPDAKCVTTGGQGRGEDVSEAAAMAQYLIDRGIDESRIFTDTTSTDTRENFENAKEILEENNLPLDIVIVTDGYHQYRSSLLAKELGFQYANISCSTKLVDLPTFWVREWLALVEFFLLHR